MNKLDLLEEYKDMLCHNLLCYSEDYLMTKPKSEFVEQWKKEREKVDLLEEIIKESKELNKNFTQGQILKLYPNIQYQVRNSNGGLLAGTVEFKDAKKYAEKYKKEYLSDKLNSKVGVYVFDKNGKNLYVAKGDKSNIKMDEIEELE